MSPELIFPPGLMQQPAISAIHRLFSVVPLVYRVAPKYPLSQAYPRHVPYFTSREDPEPKMHPLLSEGRTGANSVSSEPRSPGLSVPWGVGGHPLSSHTPGLGTCPPTISAAVELNLVVGVHSLSASCCPRALMLPVCIAFTSPAPLKEWDWASRSLPVEHGRCPRPCLTSPGGLAELENLVHSPESTDSAEDPKLFQPPKGRAQEACSQALGSCPRGFASFRGFCV